MMERDPVSGKNKTKTDPPAGCQVEQVEGGWEGTGRGQHGWGASRRDKGRKKEPGPERKISLGQEKRGQNRGLSRRQKTQKLGKDHRKHQSRAGRSGSCL